jgi:hypothetical protein
MKRLFALLPLVCSLVGHASSPVGLLPEERVAVEVSDTEKSPFGTKAVTIGQQPKNTENEESWIRLVFERLPVSGVVQAESGRKVLLGSLAIEEGKELPPVIPRQQERLRVLAITDERAEIGFVEEDGSSHRKIIVPLDVAPDVQFRLGIKAAPAKRSGLDGVITKDDIALPPR